MNTAYSLIEVKGLDESKRTFSGWATTPETDRVGDTINPLGASFDNPITLLHQHNSDAPIGSVRLKKPTARGIEFEAEIPVIKEPGPLKDRVDTAWGEIKNKLVRAVSIGFRPIKHAFKNDGGVDFQEIEIYELSTVSVPANVGALITNVKSVIPFDKPGDDPGKQSFDMQSRAASGRKALPVVRLDPPGASGLSKPRAAPQEGTDMKTLAEQITALEAKRAAEVARMETAMQKSLDEDRTTDTAEDEEFKDAESIVARCDADLEKLRKLESVKALSAKPVIKSPSIVPDGDEGDGIVVRHGISVKSPPKLAPGIAFAQLARVKVLSKLDHERPIDIAKHLYGDDSPAVLTLKATVPAGSTASGNWGQYLVGTESGAVADFVEYLRTKTIVGAFGTNGIPSLRDVPFYTPLVTQTAAAAGYWVGEGKAKPLTNANFSRTTLTPLKVANICVLTEESIRYSNPKSDTIMRDELVMALQARLDTDFVDPNKTASAGVSPASITNGAPTIASSGTDDDALRLDIRALFDVFDTANNPAESAVLIMSPRNARGAASIRNPLGQTAFPNMTARGGTIDGTPVIVSSYVDNNVILLNASDIYLGDEGGVAVDMSREASLEMSDAPAHNSTTPTGASLVSMFQTNSVAIRAERTINWARRRTNSVVRLTGAQFGGDLPTV